MDAATTVELGAFAPLRFAEYYRLVLLGYVAWKVKDD